MIVGFLETASQIVNISIKRRTDIVFPSQADLECRMGARTTGPFGRCWALERKFVRGPANKESRTIELLLREAIDDQGVTMFQPNTSSKILLFTSSKRKSKSNNKKQKQKQEQQQKQKQEQIKKKNTSKSKFESNLESKLERVRKKQKAKAKAKAKVKGKRQKKNKSKSKSKSQNNKKQKQKQEQNKKTSKSKFESN